MRRLVLVVLSMGVLAQGTAAAEGNGTLAKEEAAAIMSAEGRHVRPVDARLRLAVTDGLRRSATLAHLVLALDRTDVIVYLETGTTLHPSLAGRLLMAATTSGSRYLRVQIAPWLRGNELIAIIGHELQHALEVAHSPGVRDERSLAALYRTIGHAAEGSHQYDTAAAREAGRQVRSELAG